MFGTRRDTSSIAFEDQSTNAKSLYPENIRNLLTVLGEAEKNAHDGKKGVVSMGFCIDHDNKEQRCSWSV